MKKIRVRLSGRKSKGKLQQAIFESERDLKFQAEIINIRNQQERDRKMENQHIFNLMKEQKEKDERI